MGVGSGERVPLPLAPPALLEDGAGEAVAPELSVGAAGVPVAVGALAVTLPSGKAVPVGREALGVGT